MQGLNVEIDATEHTRRQAAADVTTALLTVVALAEREMQAETAAAFQAGMEQAERERKARYARPREETPAVT